MLTQDRFKYFGVNAKIHEYTKIIRPEVVEVGDGCQLDDFTLINGGQGIILGKKNHIASFVSIIGGGKFFTGDYVGIAAGARIITGTHHYGDGFRISPLIPEEEQYVVRGFVRLEKDVFIGSNAIIFPNVTVGEGAIVGAGAVVNKDIEPWTINVGMPAKVIGTRPKIKHSGD